MRSIRNKARLDWAASMVFVLFVQIVMQGNSSPLVNKAASFKPDAQIPRYIMHIYRSQNSGSWVVDNSYSWAQQSALASVVGSRTVSFVC